jgi:hypothetical protein
MLVCTVNACFLLCAVLLKTQSVLALCVHVPNDAAAAVLASVFLNVLQTCDISCVIASYCMCWCYQRVPVVYMCSFCR